MFAVSGENRNSECLGQIMAGRIFLTQLRPSDGRMRSNDGWQIRGRFRLLQDRSADLTDEKNPEQLLNENLSALRN